MFTYLHHSDPTIPHYRQNEWSFLRGAAATVDRPLMGWMGRFFMHNVIVFRNHRMLLPQPLTLFCYVRSRMTTLLTTSSLELPSVR